MELREFMSVRKAYNLVRQETETPERLTFEELAILCHLADATEPIKTSDIASYQGALRPTMTHRTNHLSELGYIVREEGADDRRNIVCSLSDKGRARALELAQLTCGKIVTGKPLARTSSERMCKYVDAMGSVYCTAGELVQLCLYTDPENKGCTVMTLVGRLGLLQPTVSMSVASLAKRGLVERRSAKDGSARSMIVALTEEGLAQMQPLAERIDALVVRRKPRSVSLAQE